MLLETQGTNWAELQKGPGPKHWCIEPKDKGYTPCKQLKGRNNTRRKQKEDSNNQKDKRKTNRKPEI
uniref:Uncharacterized protein n=1 Tax=Caenorhabditis tropicalis TaxID=1561998 RepID=A0A1I7UWX3_9PELO